MGSGRCGLRRSGAWSGGGYSSTLGSLTAVECAASVTPQLQVHLRLEDQASDLIADGVDLAIRGGLPPPDSHNVRARALASIPTFLASAEASFVTGTTLVVDGGMRVL